MTANYDSRANSKTRRQLYGPMSKCSYVLIREALLNFKELQNTQQQAFKFSNHQKYNISKEISPKQIPNHQTPKSKKKTLPQRKTATTTKYGRNKLPKMSKYYLKSFVSNLNLLILILHFSIRRINRTDSRRSLERYRKMDRKERAENRYLQNTISEFLVCEYEVYADRRCFGGVADFAEDLA